MFEKIEKIQNHLKSKFVERDEIIDSIFVSIVARQHCLLVGPPGTAKSALVSEIANSIQGMNYFQWLLTRFSTPEELFGPVSLQELEKGIYKRNTSKKLPEAHLTFLDEIFKANSAILNALLTLINERLFYNNGSPVQTPLLSVIGASNEYPEDGEGLEALFDRFLLRFEMDYIGEDQSFLSMLKGNASSDPEPLSLQEIDQLQFLADMVTIPDEVLNMLVCIRNDLKDEGIRPSDRRFRQTLSLLKAKAALDQRQFVKISDLLILRNGLWNSVDQKEKCFDIVNGYAQDKLRLRLDEIEKIGRNVYESASKLQTTEAGLEANSKLKELLGDMEDLKSQYPNRIDEIEDVQRKVSHAQKNLTTIILGM